jgi:RNA polymerase sigma factor (sigma-70 family)
VLSDHDLLAEYVHRGDHLAFAEVVRRHVDLVYNACLRQTRGDRHLAEDATQAVFFLLARRAARLGPRVVVAGWLYTTARHAAANAARGEARRRRHERKAAQHMSVATPSPVDAVSEAPAWDEVAPVLDDAVNALSARDRDAVILRYFEDKSVRDVAEALGVSVDAAKQRLSRAVERLRRAFARRGVAASAGGVAALLAGANAQAAPAGLIGAAVTASAGAVGSVAAIAKAAAMIGRLKTVLSWAASAGVAAVVVVVALGATLRLRAGPPGATVIAPAVPMPPASRPTSAPTTTLVNDRVDAAALVRAVRDAESWVDRVKSLRLKVEAEWVPPPPPPAGAPLPATPFSARPETAVSAFDDHRVYYRAEAQEYLLIDHRTWDGKVAVSHSKYSPKERNQEQYALTNEPDGAGMMVLMNLCWPRAGPHNFWWAKNRGAGREDIYGGRPEDFRLAGREQFRGVECYVLESELYYRTLYVGVADGRLYGLANRVTARWSANSREPISREVASAMAKRPLTRAQMNQWLTELAPAERVAYQKEVFKRMRPFTVPQSTYWLGEYKEVAPGCWMPMRQGYDVWGDSKDPTTEPAVTGRRETRVIEVVVDQPLPDEWFKWEFEEGVEVADVRTDLKLFYKHKKHFTAAEWEEILDDARQRNARRRPGSSSVQAQLSRPRVLGKQAPEMTSMGSTWLNGGPLKLADLKGKIVMIEFLGAWSKFSREELPKVNELHARAAAEGIVVIGVHSAGTPVDDVRAWLMANGVTFPVCVDGPAERGPWDGELFNAYHVDEMPTAFVVNRDGRVIFEGTPGGAVTSAQRATTQPSKPAGR